MFFDPYYLLWVLPALVVAGLASLYTQTTFSKYSRVRSRFGYTGAEAARTLLDANELHDVKVQQVSGFLSDHYDPISRTLRLSPGVYGSTSLAAIGVACHEAGHAIQHAKHYVPLALRSALVPAAQIGSYLSYIVFALGLMASSLALVKVGIALFSATVLFAVVTLPVEWNASSRAKALMVQNAVVSSDEAPYAAKVLNAAFLTYVAALFSALMTLLYFLARAGLLGGGSRRR